MKTKKKALVIGILTVVTSLIHIGINYNKVLNTGTNVPEEKYTTEKWGLIDTTGKEITPLKYDMMYRYHKMFAIVKLNDKYGFIDKKGKEI